MSDQRAIPFMHMRGGTSKGPVFNKKDLPEDRDTLANVLLAATSSQCLAACVLAPGTVADGMADKPNENPATITIEHPLGAMDMTIDFESNGLNSTVHSAEILRTTRKLIAGEIFVPSDIWAST